MIRPLRRVTPRPAAVAGAHAVRLVALGYAGQMALGFALLSLPFAQNIPVAPPDAVFVAVSAVSTTGPSAVDLGSSFTGFGQPVILLLAVLRGREAVTLFGVFVPPAKMRQAIATFFMAATVLTAAMFPPVATETLDFGHLPFEAISATGTVGLSLGATAALTDAGKAVICVVMYVGRVGVLAFGVALAMRQRRTHVIPRREDLAI